MAPFDPPGSVRQSSLRHGQIAQEGAVAATRNGGGIQLPVEALRGFFALLVYAYHTLYALKILDLAAASFFAVYGFFAISGFVLTLNYRDKIGDTRALAVFAGRRIARLWPLYIFVLLVSALLMASIPSDFGYRLLLNATLTFGFLNPGATSLVGGGWSIGIEIVFYAVFPFIIALLRISRLALVLVTILMLCIGAAHAHHLFDGVTRMTPQLWQTFVQPGSFAGYFLFGCLLSEIRRSFPSLFVPTWIAVLIWVLGIAALLIPHQVATSVLTWPKGAIYLVTTLGLVAVGAFMSQPSGVAGWLAKWLGRLSYGIYLLHPLVNLALVKLGFLSAPFAFICLSLGLTFIFSILSFNFLEDPARRYLRARAKM